RYPDLDGTERRPALPLTVERLRRSLGNRGSAWHTIYAATEKQFFAAAGVNTVTAISGMITPPQPTLLKGSCNTTITTRFSCHSRISPVLRASVPRTGPFPQSAAATFWEGPVA